MSKIKRISGLVVLGLLVVSLVVLGSQALTEAQEEESFAYVDTVRLWNELPQMHEMRTILEQETKEKQAAYDQEAAKLEDEEAKRKLFQKYQDELDARKDALFAQALENTYELIKAVAVEEGYAVVLEKQSVIYGGYDLTDAVIQAAKKQ